MQSKDPKTGICQLSRWGGFRIISDYLPTRESGESKVCPSFGGQFETSMGRSSKLFIVVICSVASLLLVVLTLRVRSGKGDPFIC